MLPDGFSLLDPDTLQATINISIYSRPAVMRACYAATNRSYVFLVPGPEPDTLLITFSKREPSQDLSVLAGEFFNDLLDQELRVQIARETSDVRTLLVAQAFAEGNLLDPRQQNDSSLDDPRDVLKHD
jgi:His-Xaa-Ser system protein HxsD